MQTISAFRVFAAFLTTWIDRPGGTNAIKIYSIYILVLTIFIIIIIQWHNINWLRQPPISILANSYFFVMLYIIKSMLWFLSLSLICYLYSTKHFQLLLLVLLVYYQQQNYDLQQRLMCYCYYYYYYYYHYSCCLVMVTFQRCL